MQGKSKQSLQLILLAMLAGCGGGSSGGNLVFDIDGDGVEDSRDAFPQDSTESADTDSDGIGNNADTDDDGDGVPDTEDAFPLDGSETLDTDSDGIGDVADPDLDNDGIPDEIDTDSDNDGVEDAQDAFPLNSTETLDTDGDGIGNNTDADDDGDGNPDVDDALPLTPNALPTVTVSPSLTVNEKSNLLLTATGTDADGPVTYLWSQLSGTPVTLQQETSATVSITTPAVTQDEQVVLQVTVTDTDNLTESQSINLLVTANTPPTISISLPVLTGIVGETFVFDASQTSDVDNDAIGFLWNLDVFPAANANLLSSFSSAVTALSTAIYGDYQISLTVSDGLEISSQIINVTVQPSRFGAARYGNHAWSHSQ